VDKGKSLGKCILYILLMPVRIHVLYLTTQLRHKRAGQQVTPSFATELGYGLGLP